MSLNILEALSPSLSAATRPMALVGDEENGTVTELVDGTGSHACRNSRIQTRSHKETVNPVGKAG